MDIKKICFITCVNDYAIYNEALLYIQNLDVPDGYQVEVIDISEVSSTAEAYNEAMKMSDAKYKVYIQENVFIINKNIIHDIINLFKSNKEIGIIGIRGSKTISPSGEWKDSRKKYGKLYESTSGTMKLEEYEEILDQCEIVQAIDEAIIITQYDIPWREDIFDGWYYYNLSQCMEFIKNGYKAAIPKQEEPWCIYDSNDLNIYDEFDKYKYKDVFLDEYSKDIFPLVTIMMTAYNRPYYFKIALQSALNQTYRNIEILVCDNSTNDEVEEVIQPYLEKYLNIRYKRNEESIEVIDNFRQCLRLSKGEYVAYLMDDDIYHMDKISKMMHYYLEYDDISLVTSYRQVIDADGNMLNPLRATQKLFDSTTIITGGEIRNFVYENLLNVIGETTTPLFRRKDINEDKFGVYLGRQYEVIADLATWTQILTKGNMVYFSEALSYFRIHAGQDQRRIKTIIKGVNEWYYLLKDSYENGYINNDNHYKNMLRNWYKENNCIWNMIPKDYNRSGKEIKSLNTNFNEYNSVISEKDLENVIKINYSPDTLSKESKNNLPLVSILIPAYNQTEYLKEALESAINQTYPNIEIIIGDDSSNNDVKEFIEPYLTKHGNIVYFKNEREIMDYGISNVENLFINSRGEYIAYLLHDDIFHKEKISKMISCFLDQPGISLVTSYRKLIDNNGNILADSSLNKKLSNSDIRISGIEMSKYIVSNVHNPIGELSTTLFRKRDIEGKVLNYHDKALRCNGDIALWLKLLEKGDLAYISESLNYFRQHDDQNSKNLEMHLYGTIDWIDIIDEFYRVNELDADKNQYKNDIINCYSKHFDILKELHKIKNIKVKEEFISKFNIFLYTLLKE